MKTVLIAGTHAWRNDGRQEWYCPGSPFATFLESQHVSPLFVPDTVTEKPQPFVWSTAIGGVGWGSGDLVAWAAAGVSLFQLVVPPLCPERRVPAAGLALIAHSHGLQVALYACAAGLKVDTLISVSSPIRKDMTATAQRARPNIRHWLHLHSDGSDKMQWLGELFDGHLGIVRAHPLADVNEATPGVGHSDVLNRPEDFHYWVDRGWLKGLA
jgi:hypothetical protein